MYIYSQIYGKGRNLAIGQGFSLARSITLVIASPEPWISACGRIDITLPSSTNIVHRRRALQCGLYCANFTRDRTHLKNSNPTKSFLHDAKSTRNSGLEIRDSPRRATVNLGRPAAVNDILIPACEQKVWIGQKVLNEHHSIQPCTVPARTSTQISELFNGYSRCNTKKHIGPSN